MRLCVNATDWNSLSLEAQDRITQMLRDSHLLAQEDSLYPDPNLPSLRHEKAPSLLDPSIAHLLQQAAPAGLEAVAIYTCVHHSTVEPVACFVVAYETRSSHSPRNS